MRYTELDLATLVRDFASDFEAVPTGVGALRWFRENPYRLESHLDAADDSGFGAYLCQRARNACRRPVDDIWRDYDISLIYGELSLERDARKRHQEMVKELDEFFGQVITQFCLR